ncbi:MAG: hypothetical protein ABIN91_17735 [Mucilaginibacter sp.]|uniref:hypothetical protein n=1 Tax=Mucilaginibacter sp. TaxID=1882438 RepID=UPI00326396FB
MKLKTLINDFIALYFPDAYGACLTGSMVDDNFNSESDIDLWILTQSRDYFFTETFSFRKHKVQVAHFPFDKISEILWMDYINRRGLYLAAFAKATSIIDTDGFLQSIIERCDKLFKDGPQKVTPYDQYKKKIKVIEGLSDLKGAASNDESCIIIADLLANFISLYNTQNQIWDFTGKHSIRILKKTNENLANKLMKTYKGFYTNYDKKPFIKLVDRYVKLIGGHPNGYSSHFGALNSKNDYLVMQFYNHKDSHQFIKNKYESIFKILIEKCIRVAFFEARPMGDAFDSNHSIYITVFFDSKNDHSRETLKYYITELRTLIKEKITFAFPVNIDWGLILGAEQLIKPTSIFLSQLSAWVVKNVTSQSLTLIGAISLFKDIHAVFFANNVEFMDFLDYLYNTWIVKSYDNGQVYGFEQIIIAKKEMEDLFSNQYTGQKIAIKKVYAELDFTFEFLRPLKPVITTEMDKHKLFFENPYFLTQNYDSSSWPLLKNILDLSLGTLLIPDEKKAYLPFLFKRILIESQVDILETA